MLCASAPHPALHRALKFWLQPNRPAETMTMHHARSFSPVTRTESLMPSQGMCKHCSTRLSSVKGAGWLQGNCQLAQSRTKSTLVHVPAYFQQKQLAAAQEPLTATCSSADRLQTGAAYATGILEVRESDIHVVWTLTEKVGCK